MSYSPQHLDRLRLRHLRLLELIEREGSLRAVGGILNLTQPAVSQMVKDLEQAFGVTLVDRSPRGVALSAAGMQALQRARSGLATFDHLATELQAHLQPALRVGINPAVMFQLVPAAIAKLEADGTRPRFKVHAGLVNEMLAELWAGNLDCYVGRIDWDRLPPSMSGALRYEPLVVTDLILACSARHPLAGRNGISVQELLAWPWALPLRDSNNRTAFETAFRNHGLAGPSPAVEVAADPNALMLLARQVDYLVCIPRLALDIRTETEALCALDVPDFHLPPIQIGFVTLVEHESMTAVKAFKQALVEVARNGP